MSVAICEVSVSARVFNFFAYLLKRPSKYVFREHEKSDLDGFGRTFYELGDRISRKLANPRLMKNGFRTLRHFKATLEHYRTKDILYVKQLLGHKNIQNTLVYTHLVNFESDEFSVKVGSSLEECTKLLEAGFEYITDYESKKIFRKRK